MRVCTFLVRIALNHLFFFLSVITSWRLIGVCLRSSFITKICIYSSFLYIYILFFFSIHYEHELFIIISFSSFLWEANSSWKHVHVYTPYFWGQYLCYHVKRQRKRSRGIAVERTKKYAAFTQLPS